MNRNRQAPSQGDQEQNGGHEVSNSNQEELTEHCVVKGKPPTFFLIPALEHCYLALYSSRRFKKINNLRGKKDLQIMTLGDNLP